MIATREAACAAMTSHYDQARAELARSGLFGKTLDNKARKLALKLAGVSLPEGRTIAWATPDGWADGPGYRGQTAKQMQAPRKPGRPALPDELKRTARISTRTYPDVADKVSRNGTEWLEEVIMHAKDKT